MLNITPVNDLPVISNIGRQFVQENGFTVVNFNVQDVETAAGALVVSASAADKTLVPDAGLALSGSDGNRALAITPAPNQIGSTAITLLVSDADGVHYDPTNLPGCYKKEGLRVDVTFKVRNDLGGIHMAGPIVEIESIGSVGLVCALAS